MGLLLDTHVFLWWDSRDKALSADTRALIADPTNQVLVSAASVWEIAIKRRMRKLDFRGSAVARLAPMASTCCRSRRSTQRMPVRWHGNRTRVRPHGNSSLPEHCPDVVGLTPATLSD